MAPQISIVVPVYNGEKYIAKCIESLLCQTLRDIEVIVVNDGSKDNTINIVNQFAKRDSRVIVVDKANEGVSVARNTGIQKSRGQWIAFSDADDYYYPDGLQNLYNAANITGARIVLGNADKINIDGKIRQRHDKEKIELRHEYPQCSFEMWGNLYERTLLWEKIMAFNLVWHTLKTVCCRPKCLRKKAVMGYVRFPYMRILKMMIPLWQAKMD